MKTLITTLALMSTLIALPVQAGGICAEKETFCNRLGSMSESLMTARLEGVSLSKILAVNEAAPADLQPLLNAIVTEAYESPAYSTEKMKTKAITEFGNKQLLNCRKTMLKKCK